MNKDSKLELVNKVIRSYAKNARRGDVDLDSNLNISFGSYGFKFDKKKDILYGRAYIGKAVIKGASQEWIDNARKMVVTLNDPKIGGMFEHDGAIFILDEEKESYFMVQTFALDSLSAKKITKKMDKLQSLAATWSMTWLFHVARIMHGHEPAPTTKVTQKNNTYR